MHPARKKMMMDWMQKKAMMNPKTGLEEHVEPEVPYMAYGGFSEMPSEDMRNDIESPDEWDEDDSEDGSGSELEQESDYGHAGMEQSYPMDALAMGGKAKAAWMGRKKLGARKMSIGGMIDGHVSNFSKALRKMSIR